MSSNPQPIPLSPPPPKKKRVSVPVLLGVIGAFILGLVIGGASGSRSPQLDAAQERISQLEAQLAAPTTAPAPPQESAAPAPAPAEAHRETVTFSGDGRMQSEKARLEGDYGVAWETKGSCYYSAQLEGGSTIGEQVFTASDRPLTGTGNIYGLDATDYYLDVITGPAPGCGWSVTLTPK